MARKINSHILPWTFILSLFLWTCEDLQDDLPKELPVADTTPPQAVIIYPVDGVSVSGDVTIVTRATDNDEVDSVQFYINQKWVGTDTTGAEDLFEYVWNTREYKEDDFHFISIVGYDAAENEYASFPIRLKADNTDNEPPVAFLLNPFAGQVVQGLVEITVEATDNDSVQYVSYYINNILQGYVLERPYTYLWNTATVVDDEYYSIYTVARDMSNNVTTVPPISVLVNNDIQNDLMPPTGSITSPPAGLTVSGEVSIIISATDNRAMGEVALSIDGNYITTIQETPYYYIWDTTLEEEDAEHTISVVLIDLAGNETALNPISVFVDNEPPEDTTPPTVLIMEPAAGQNLSGVVSIKVHAEDDTGIDRIEFFVNGDSVHTDDTEPYNFEWDTETVTDDMEHIIAVMGFDLDGNGMLGSPIAVYIDNFDNVAPSGQILSPVAGQTVEGMTTIEISATDNIGIATIDLSINGNYRITLTDYPYTYEWDTTDETDDSDHVISVVVADSSDNIAYVQPVSVYVNNITDDITPPVIAITNPLSGQSVSGVVNFKVMANDDFGISIVDFFVNGESIGSDTEADYQKDWNTTSLENGSQHTLSASVTDNAGHTTIAQPILVTVSNE